MRTHTLLSHIAIVFTTVISVTTAQYSYAEKYTDPTTGITFGSAFIRDGTTGTTTQGGFAFGMALPESAATTDSPDYIGMITGSLIDGKGWSGISHNGGMVNGLLLVAWTYEGRVQYSLRTAGAYAEPEIYTGTNATIMPISETVTADKYTFIYLCKGCLLAESPLFNGPTGTSSGLNIIGWAQALNNPTNPSDNTSPVGAQHDNGYGTYGQQISNCTNASYEAWAATAVTTLTSGTSASGNETSTTNTTTITPVTIPFSSRAVPAGASFDYIVVGGGAGGLPMADRLSEAGKSTLLIERGPPSSGRQGGNLKPAWLDGTNLTRFDVPGLCNQIWSGTAPNSGGIKCTDVTQMSGCVLGGGTAINAGLWWNPNPTDWDFNFPTGWKATDMASASARVFARIPGTDTPSMDDERYYTEGFDVLSSGLADAGWESVKANEVPEKKNHTFTHTPYMFANGERGGPMATYLESALARENFDLWVNTTVKRVIRSGGLITGVEVEPYADGGYAGIVNVTAATGRVILSAGAFGSSKILFRSGIGPADQLEIVQNSTDGSTMIESTEWINLPVGKNLDDHTNTDLVISHPNVTFYDFYAAWSAPIEADKNSYLNNRTGILAQSAPNIGPIMFEEIEGADGIVRQMQYTSRVEGSDGHESGKTMTISQYLGRGSKSRGRTTLDKNLNMVVSTVPYLQDAEDLAAVIQSIKNIQAALSNVQDLVFLSPGSNVSVEDYVASKDIDTSRSANHWVGTAKMGTDDGRTESGTAVVDTNCKVYGTDNLFVVDASIFPGMVTTNPSALIVTVAEKASEVILALSDTNKSVAKNPISMAAVAPDLDTEMAPSGTNFTPPATTFAPSVTLPTSQPSASDPARSASGGAGGKMYDQCGGSSSWTGPTSCTEGTCTVMNDFYAQCL